MNKIIAALLFTFSATAVAGDAPEAQIKASGTMYFIFDMASETTVNGILFARFVPDEKSLENFSAVTSGKHPGGGQVHFPLSS